MAVLQSSKSSNSGIVLVSIIWIVAILSASLVALWQGGVDASLWLYSLCAMAPALFALALYPVLDREWAQISIILAWILLAISATLAIAFVPMAFLFLCAPAAAALFAREKVIEAMVLSALAAGFVYYAARFGFSTPVNLPQAFSDWGRATAPAATIVFMIGAMYAVSSYRDEADWVPVYEPEEIAAETLLDVYPGAAFHLHSDGSVLNASSSAYDFLFVSRSEVKDKSFMLLLSLIDEGEGEGAGQTFHKTHKTQAGRLAQIIDEVDISGRSQQLNVEVHTQDDGRAAIRELDVTIAPDTNVGVYAFVRDISPHVRELQKTVKGLELAERDNEKRIEEKSLFFAGVSHELRTPLNAIIGFSDMMRSRLFGPLPGKYAEYAQLINESGQHMLDLIGDVLDVSKLEAGKYELIYDEFDAADVVRSSVKMIRPAADAAKVEINLDISDDDPVMLRADRRAVRQILLNLLSNAIKFSPKGSRTTVSAIRLGQTVRIAVQDQGHGMSEQEIARIGEPYAQGASAAMTDSRGSGLGLSLVKSLVDLHGGKFVITSTPESGTLVSINLPSKGLSE